MASLAVVGLGRIGGPIALCWASRGHRVHGVDANADVVSRFGSGAVPFFEPGLAELRKGAAAFRVSTSPALAVSESEVIFLVLPTPSEEGGGFSTRYLLPACREIGAAFRARKNFPVVCVVSTVMPGTMRGEIAPALEKASGMRCGIDFGLCYGPAFVALGSVVRDYLSSPIVLVGESDNRTGRKMQELYESLAPPRRQIARMNWINAEITKLAFNTYMTQRMSFANTMARLCERLPEADAEAVLGALRIDPRIGPGHLKGAIAYGGPCLPRDNQALSSLAAKVGAILPLPEAVDRFNRGQADWLAARVMEIAGQRRSIGILGLSYKPDTDVIDESPGVRLAELLVDLGCAVTVFDPASMENAKDVLRGRVRYAGSLEDCVAASEVVVIATAWSEFHRLPLPRSGARKKVVLDCWGILDSSQHGEVEYLPLGRGPRSSGDRA